MLNTKEHFKQIEMDTIQQEPLFTELTPEAAATVEGGLLYTTDGVDSRLNIRSNPNLRFSRIIGSIGAGWKFGATKRTTNGFRQLLGQKGWVAAAFTKLVR